MCVAIGIGAASLIGGAISAGGAESAASTQAGAQENAANLQEQMFQQTVGNEAPYRQAGAGAQSELNYLLGIGTPGQSGQYGATAANGGGAGGYGSLLTPFTTANFKQLSPAYNFQLQQGAQNTLSGAASGQGALSGAAMTGLQANNQGMANTAFNNAFNQYQTQQGNIYARLAGIAQTGQAAASNQATGASNFGSSIGSQVAGAGASLAGGTVGAANSISNGIGNAALYSAFGGGGSGNSFDPNYVNYQMGDSPLVPTPTAGMPGQPTGP